MKILVINLSGNVGKTTITRNLFSPRIKDVEIISVESSNSDGQEDLIIKGKKFTELLMAVGILDSAIVDVGASNAEDFLWGMKQQPGAHEEFDLFVIPTVGKSKQLSDTIVTIINLSNLGIPPNKIKVIFNQVEYDDLVEETFGPIYQHYENTKGFEIIDEYINTNELFPRMVKHKTTIKEVLNDNTDYKGLMKVCENTEEKLALLEMIGLRRLANGANQQLETVYKAVM